MKAAVITETGVAVREVAKPTPAAGQVLVRVRAAGLNRADVIMASGHMHGSAGGPGTILGLEFAGEVAAVGAGVTSVKAGDRVMASGGSAYAEYALADAGRVSKIPANNMSFVQAATLPVALQTMHNAIVTAGRLKPGESVLIQGASSGVGLMGLQIAKVMGAGLVVGTSTNAGRRARLAEFGADVAVDTTEAGWSRHVLDATGGKGVDLIIDQVSASVADENMKAAAVLGRIVNVGRLGGFKGPFDFDLHALKRIDYIGVTFRTRSPDEVREIVRVMREDLWPHVESGRLALPIDRSYPLEEAAAALAHMKANAHFGKIALTM
jgi:NADPH:quinone reductase